MQNHNKFATSNSSTSKIFLWKCPKSTALTKQDTNSIIDCKYSKMKMTNWEMKGKRWWNRMLIWKENWCKLIDWSFNWERQEKIVRINWNLWSEKTRKLLLLKNKWKILKSYNSKWKNWKLQMSNSRQNSKIFNKI